MEKHRPRSVDARWFARGVRKTSGGRPAGRQIWAAVVAVVVAVPVGVWIVSPDLLLNPVRAVNASVCLPPGSGEGPAGPASLPEPSTGPRAPPESVSDWSGPRLISTSIAYRNVTISLTEGDLIVAPGGSLLLDNVSLTVAQVNGSTPRPLSFGVVVESGGQLTARYTSIQGADGPWDPGFVVVGGTAQFLHVRFDNLGGTATSPVPGREGVLVRSGHVQFEDDVFDRTYQVLFDGPEAVGDGVDGSTWVDSTISGGAVGWVQISDGASWTNLTGDAWNGCTDAGMLALIEGPHVTLRGSSLEGDPNGLDPEQVYLTYNGSADDGIDASWASLIDDRFQTANLGISDGGHFAIDQDWFNDTGHWSGTGGAAAIIVATWIGSGVGEVTRDVDIEQNVIANFTHYAIRVSQNVSGFNVSSNRIYNTRSTYSEAIAEADGVYLIRGVNNGTVWNNTLDMTDSTDPSGPTNGIILEAQVNDVNVSANSIMNCSEVGITVQGDSGALPAPRYYLGASSRNTLYGNSVENFHDMSAQTTFSTEAIETWMWANGTRILDNTLRGWAEVSGADYWNGAGVFTSSSRQLIEGNRISDARFGFVFQRFDGAQELPSLGSFNRSYNLLAGNELVGIVVDSLVENADDGMGPIVNLLSGSIDPGWTLSFSGPTATLRIENATLSAFGPTSPYWVANVDFSGTVTLSSAGATFDLPLARWVTAPAQISFDNVRASFPVEAGGWNITFGNSSAGSGDVNWTMAQTGNATDSFYFEALEPGRAYGLFIDGILTQVANASPAGVLSMLWVGIGSHQFGLALVANSTSAARLVAADVAPPAASGATRSGPADGLCKTSGLLSSSTDENLFGDRAPSIACARTCDVRFNLRPVENHGQ